MMCAGCGNDAVHCFDCEDKQIKRAVEAERERADERVEAMWPYMRHRNDPDSFCSMLKHGANPCDCGLAAAIRERGGDQPAKGDSA